MNIELDQIVLIQPGERIPLDSVVIQGQSYVDKATITAESLPVNKELGDKVFASTLTKNSAPDVRVIQLASESTLAHIIKMVEDAQRRNYGKAHQRVRPGRHNRGWRKRCP